MTPDLDWRCIFILGLVAGAAFADYSRPARQVPHEGIPIERCETDEECEAACYAKLPPNRPETECEVEL